MNGLYIIIGFAALIIFAFISMAMNMKKRREDLRRLAEQEEWSFHRNGRTFASVLSHFPLLSQGHTRRAYNVLQCGAGPDEAWIFDYRYTTGSGKHSRVHRQTVIAFPYLDANLPAFQSRPEHLLHKVAGAFGYQDIDIPQLAEFSSRYLLRGKDEPAIRQLFDHDLVRSFDGGRRRTIEGAGSCLLIYRHRHVIGVDDILPSLDDARHVRDAFLRRCHTIGWMPQPPPVPALA